MAEQSRKSHESSFLVAGPSTAALLHFAGARFASLALDEPLTLSFVALPSFRTHF
jgi:hypothetical protein